MIKHFTKTLFIVWTCLNCFGAQAQTCPANLGTTINIASLPYSGTGLTTCGAGNDITGSNATICGSSNYYGGEDLVFIFTPTTTGNQVISLTSSSAWIGMMLYNGCPFLGQGGSCVSNVQSSTGSKSMTVSVTAGTTYYLVVDTWPSPTCIPSFDLSIAPPPPPPANDNCATATAFPTIPTTGACVTLSNQNTANATNSNVTPTGACSSNSGTPDDDIWFSFVAPATTVILEGTFVSGVTDVYWQVFSGSCGSTMTSVLCTDTNAGGTITGLTVGATYYIRLYTWSSGVSTVQNVCLRTNAAPPSNDECATATPLTSNTTCVTTTGTSSGASQSIAPITCASFTSSSALDVWYSFTAVTSSHTVTVTGQSTFDAVVDVRSGACNGTNIACSDITSGGGTETVSLTGLTVGDTYYVRVYGWAGTTGNFTICVTNPALPPCLASPTSPANSAALCLPGPGTLSWPTSSGATSYDVYFGASPTPPFVANTASTSYSVGNLAKGTYYWQIRPVNANGTASGCTIWSFTVDLVAPTISNCPANQNVNRNASCVAILPDYTGVPTTSDNCPGAINISQSPTAGTTLNGTTTVVLTATDAAGNTATCSFTATPVDATPPTLSNCPANQNVNRDASCTATLPDYTGVPTTSDNCPGTINISQSPTAGGMLLGTTTVVLTATDVAGNTATCSFTATPVDVTPPTLSNCPGNQTASVNGNCQGVLANYTGGVTASDNCPGVGAVTQSPAAGSTFTGTTIVTLSATDASSNTGTCTFTVQVADNTPPSIQCGAGTFSAAANSSCQYVLANLSAATTSSDNCGTPTISQTPAVGTVLGLGATTVTMRATDANSNTATCLITVTVSDQTPPSITCPANATVAAGANCSATLASYTAAATASDNCTASPAKTQSPATGTVLPLGAQTVTLTATDAAGNPGTCSFTVTVTDQTPPSITCPANATVAAGVNCSATLASYTAAATASDNCTASPTKTQSPATGTVLPLGAQIVTLTATDAAGNPGTCSFTVTVTDQTPPSITCPANATVAAGVNCSATLASYTAAATASDNCTASPAKTQSPATGTVLPLGAQIVTLTATDAAGNPGTCSFTVTVTDQTVPSITCPNSITQANTTNQCGANVSFANATATDNCTASPTITNLGAASGSFFPVGTTSVTFRATDGVGNSSTCSFTVTVNDTQAPNISCPANITQNSAANQCGANVSFANATATDNCTASPAITNLGAASGSFFPVGTTSVTFRATDGAGNYSTCSFTIMVKDVTPPTIVCPANQNIFASSTCTGTVGSWSPLSLTDNCSPAPTFAQSPVASTGLSGHNDSKTVTLTATDASGNTASCSFTVTLKDVTPPVAKCKNATINLGANGALTLQPGSVNNGSTDNCAFTLSVTPNTFGCSNLGNTTVTLKATDAGGNTSTCTAVVTIKDATAPTALCKTINVYLNETGHASITAADVNNNSYDACGISSMSINYNQFDCGQIGGSPVYVQLTLKDASNNTSSCLASVYVKDAIAPNAVCTNTTVTLSATGFATVQTAPLAANSTDNCSVTSYSPVAKVYTASNIGVNNLTITVKDFSGNSDACVSQITVLPYGSNMPAPPTSSDQAETHEIAHDSWQGVERLDLSVFPNPTQDASTVMFSLPKEQDYRLRLFDLNGRQILDLDFHGYPGDNSVVLELGELSPGVYLIDVQSAEMHGREKLLLQR